ncbi:MAG: hypothetical protein HYS98_05150 [Deltaproteobacteria bacterium]|nr:hypothetical protein [Deltaproteobacteria bacterium]
MDLMDAFPLRDSFKYIGDDIYHYELRIPKFAPLGTLKLSALDVEDHFGNKIRLSLLPYAYGGATKTELLKTYYTYYGGSEHSSKSRELNLIPADVEIIHPGDSDYKEDRQAPKLVDAYFSKTFIVGGVRENIDLTLEFDDDSEVLHKSYIESRSDKGRQDIYVDFGPRDGHGYCARQMGPWIMDSKNTLTAPFNFDQCRNNFNRRDGQTKIIVHLASLIARDEIGNKLDLDLDLNHYKGAKFYINWTEES